MLNPPGHDEQIHAAVARAAAAAAELRALVDKGMSDAALPYWRHVTRLLPWYDVTTDRIEADRLIYDVAGIQRVLDEVKLSLARRSCKLTVDFLYEALECKRAAEAGAPAPARPEDDLYDQG